MSQNELEQFDGMLLMMANRLDGGIHQFLDIIFGFLERKTDFYTGASKADARNLVMKIFDAHCASALKKYEEQHGTKPKAASKPPAAAAAAPPPVDAGPKIQEVTAAEAEKIEKREKLAAEKASPAPAAAAAASSAAAAAAPKTPSAAKGTPAAYSDELSGLDSGDEDANAPEDANGERPKKNERGLLKPNTGNGANLEHYSWTQSLKDLDVRIPLHVSFKVRAKDVAVELRKDYLKAGLKNSPPILEGKLQHPIKVDDMQSSWMLDGNTLMLSLEKVNQMEWWSAVVAGQPEINTRKVQPENSKISDLDEESQTMVTKMMYNNQQKMRGLPTAEEQEKLNMLEKFKKAHPEMDFSNAKFT